MKYLNLLMIPTDYCNMRCKYCFFDKNIQLQNKMNTDMLEQVMKITLPFFDKVSFIWHGGESLSMGIDFYKSVVKIQKKYEEQFPVKIKNSIQSNLTLLTPEYAEFLFKEKFSLGGSFDGINNDITRGKSKQILKGKKIWEDTGGHCGLIFVASKLTVDTFISSYEFFKENKSNFKINPYLGDDPELVLDYEHYTQKLIELFEYWAYDTETPIIINMFECIIDYILTKKKNICTYTSCLGKWASINYAGVIKPCNRYFPDEYSFGNVFDYGDFHEAFESEGFKRLIIKSIQRREKCKSCEIFDYCSGGCNYVAMTENNGIENNNGLHCNHLLSVYKYIEKFLNENKENSKLNHFLKEKIAMATSSKEE